MVIPHFSANKCSRLCNKTVLLLLFNNNGLVRTHLRDAPAFLLKGRRNLIHNDHGLFAARLEAEDLRALLDAYADGSAFGLIHLCLHGFLLYVL